MARLAPRCRIRESSRKGAEAQSSDNLVSHLVSLWSLRQMIGVRESIRRIAMKTGLATVIVWSALFVANAHAQKDLTPIKIAYAAPTVDNVLIAIADSQGLFEKNGLKAELIGMRGGVQVIQSVLSGSADFGQGGGAETVQAVLSGIDVAIIAGLIPRMHYLLVTRPEISKPADLAGKKFAVASLVGTVAIVARRALDSLGVTPGRVTFLVAGPPQDRILALASGNM